MAALAAAGVAVETLMVMDGAPDWYHPGRSGTLRLGPKTVLAVFGELHPRSLQAMEIKGDRKSGVLGKSGSVSVDSGGPRHIKNKKRDARITGGLNKDKIR